MEAERVPLINGSEFHSKRPNSRRYSLNSMREEFIRGLPEKVKRSLDPERPSHIDLSRTKGLIEGEKEYYRQQFATLRSFEEVDSLPMNDNDSTDELRDRQEEFAIRISNIANVVLLAMKGPFETLMAGNMEMEKNFQKKISGIDEWERKFYIAKTTLCLL